MNVKLNAQDQRLVNIIEEFLVAKNQLQALDVNNTIVLFGSARIKNKTQAQKELAEAIKTNTNVKEKEDALFISQYYQYAQELANKLATWSESLPAKEQFTICSGGGGGIMEAANLGAKDANQKSIGLTISLPFEQTANQFLEDEYVVQFNYFFLRKFWFLYLAKGCIAFPGGFGTMDELFELLTLKQNTKMVKQIPIVLFGKEFFTKMLNLETLEKYDLIANVDKNLFLLTDSVNEAFEYIKSNYNAYES